MVESHLMPGAQKFTPGKDQVPGALEYGKSITDACMGWGDSLQVLDVLSARGQARRASQIRQGPASRLWPVWRFAGLTGLRRPLQARQAVPPRRASPCAVKSPSSSPMAQELRFDLDEVQPMPHDVARWWLDEQFTRLGCEPCAHRQGVDCRQGAVRGAGRGRTRVCRRQMGRRICPRLPARRWPNRSSMWTCQAWL
jgi:hypothetical protein